MGGEAGAASVYRLFVAIDPPPEAVADLGSWVDGLAVARAKVRVAARDQWHLTVAFLGEVPADRAGDAAGAVARAAAVTRPMRLRFAGGGRFGHGRRTIVWAGVAGDLDALTKLARTVRRELRHARLPCDDRQYRPHLTIARPGDRVAAGLVRADVAALRVYEGPLWPADALHLVRSYWPDSRHERVATSPLLR